MPHLAVPRRGWENEHLATFLLSQIAFVAHPLTVADDIGSDFFCTLFEGRQQNGAELLFPLNSFAIQVKSSRERISATNKIEYLMGLEIPFFVGVVDRLRQSLAIYSGEYLPILFSEFGRPEHFTLELVDGGSNYSNSYSLDAGRWTVRLPLTVELAAADKAEIFASKGKDLTKLCSRVHGNISARRKCEYIFRLDESGESRILAGPGSVKTFRQNFQLRLAEAFYNLQWLLQNRPSEFNVAEFTTYERTYTDMVKMGIDLPGLHDIYERVKGQINEHLKEG